MIKTVWSCLRFAFTLAILILLVLVVVYPVPIKWILTRTTVYPDYDPDTEHARVYKDHTLYSSSSSSSSSSTGFEDEHGKKKKLLIYFHGGAFLFNNRETSYGFLNTLYKKISDAFDILVFDYPVRFKYTVRDSLLAANRIITRYIGSYSDFYGIGMSAGVLLMGAFQNKERSPPSTAARMNVPIIGVKFRAMVGLSGLYDTRFDSELINRLFDFYIMRGTVGSELYTCYNSGIPVLAIGVDSDYLYQQTYRFVTTEPSEFKIYTNPELPHSFPLLVNLSETRDAIEHVADFIKKY